MAPGVSRRRLLGLSPLVLASCGKRDAYFGRTRAPSIQRLIYTIASEPSSLDPAAALGASEFYILGALFETLVSTDLKTLEPQRALATHYEVDPSLTEFIFYLRGHTHPKGARLPATGRAQMAALWSDGRPVTSHDLVCAWRRMVDPKAASLFGGSFYLLINAQEISEGRARPENLGIRADGDFALRIGLKQPNAYFLKLIGMPQFAPVPHHVVEGTDPSWARPGRMGSSGPSLLHEWRPDDRIVLRRNPWYYNAGCVQLEEILFLPITDGVTSANLYKTGEARAMHGRAVPPL